MSEPGRQFVEITHGAAAYLRFLKELGLSGFDLSEQSRAAIASWTHMAATKKPVSDGLSRQVKCRQCAFVDKRRKMIGGCGRPGARLAVIGGMPEMEDAATGKPYSGRAGALLDKILAAMSLTRDDVYLTFAVKCGGPEIPKPGIGVISACRAHLRKELANVRPAVICVFGDIAAMSLLETSTPLVRLRGRFHDYRGIPVMPTHSPEYLLAHIDAKREAWEDIKQVMAHLAAKEPFP